MKMNEYDTITNYEQTAKMNNDAIYLAKQYTIVTKEILGSITKIATIISAIFLDRQRQPNLAYRSNL